MTDEKPYSPFGDTAALIRTVGVWELGAYDGCNCSYFEVQGVKVELSCHKSEKSLIVTNTHGDGANEAMLKAVADEIMRQLADRCSSPEFAAEYTVKVVP